MAAMAWVEPSATLTVGGAACSGSGAAARRRSAAVAAAPVAAGRGGPHQAAATLRLRRPGRGGPASARGAGQPLAGAAGLALLAASAASTARRRRRSRRSGRWPRARLRAAPFQEPSADDMIPAFVQQAPPIAKYTQDSAHRQPGAQVIQHRLATDPQYQAALSLVEAYLPSFDLINMVQALHICALTGIEEESLKKQMQVNPNFINLFHRTKEAVLKDVAAVDPRTAGDLLWCCARLSIFDSELFGEIVADATKRLSSYDSLNIALLVFALGYVGQRPRAAFMQALVRELRARIDGEFNGQHVSMVVYGMMRLGIRDERLMKIVSEHILKSEMKDWNDVSVVAVALAYTKLEYWDDKVFGLLGNRVIMNLPELEPRLLCMSMLSFAKSVNFVSGAAYIMNTILEQIQNANAVQEESFLNQCSNREFATICFAAGKFTDELATMENKIGSEKWEDMGMVDSDLAREFLNQVKRRNLKNFTMAELNLINYSVMRLKHRDREFLREITDEFIFGAPELQPIEIVNALYAFGRYQYVSLKFVNAMIEETRRRNLLEEMEPASLATLIYSLGLMRVKDDETMERIAAIVTERVREFSPRQIAMVMYGLAVLGPTKHGREVASAVLEDAGARVSQYSEMSLSVVIWAAVLIAGTTSGIWILKIMFSPGFWNRPWSDAHHSMLYSVLIALRVEAGIEVEQFAGWRACFQCNEEITLAGTSRQNSRLGERLANLGVRREVNAYPPKLEGKPELGLRCDTVLEKLTLIIEVEGPKRNTIPLRRVLEQKEEKLQEERARAREEARRVLEAKDEDGPRMKRPRENDLLDDILPLTGKVEDVVAEARELVECDLVGPANFKRRVARACGWRVVTITFDENEDYICDALQKMVGKPDIVYVSETLLDILSDSLDKGVAVPEELAEQYVIPQSLADEEVVVPVDLRFARQSFSSLRAIVDNLGWQDAAKLLIQARATIERDQEGGGDGPKPMTAAEWKMENPAAQRADEPQTGDDADDMSSRVAQEISAELDSGMTSEMSIDAEGNIIETESFSEYEAGVREKHSTALEEFQRRRAARRGDAAAAGAFGSNLEFRRWQVSLEDEVFKELQDAL